MRVQIRTRLLESAEVTRLVSETCVESIMEGARAIAASFEAGGKLLLCGNGGSAADCQHMATELTNRFRTDLDRPGLPAVALTTDSSFLTAFANDFGFEDVFARQVQALGRPGDAFMAISTSGESANVVRAVSAASDRGLRTIALTGRSGRLAGLADIVIAVPSANTQHIQESHVAIEHVLCELVEDLLYPDGVES